MLCAIGGKIGFYYKEHEILPPLPGVYFSLLHGLGVVIFFLDSFFMVVNSATHMATSHIY